MAAKTITLFGGSGFIGRYIVRRLAKAGHVIRVAVREPQQARFLRPLGDVGQITPMAADVTVEASVARALDGADQAVNLVATLFDRGNAFERLHVEAPGRIGRLAAAAGVKDLLHISALGADPQSDADYARSKAVGEAAVREAFPDAVVFRPSIVIGPEDGFFNRFGAMARLAPALPLIDGGKTRFQPVYVDDVAAAAVQALSDPACRGRTFELGGPRVYSFKELMALLLQVIQRRRLLLPVPGALMKIPAAVMELLPQPPLTRDQIRLLGHDNVVSEGAEGLAALGVQPSAIEAMLPTYLDRYRPGGRFARERGPGRTTTY